MQEHIDNVLTFMEKAGQKVPQTLTIPSKEDRILRARLIIEEAFELINNGLGIGVLQNYDGGYEVQGADDFYYHDTEAVDPVEAIDGACDLAWVGVTGVAAIFGLANKLEACLKEVDENNLLKFKNGHRREDGKWVKSPDHPLVDLKSIIYG